MIPLNEEKNDISAFDMSDIEEEYKEIGIRKAAILLMTLGPETSNEIIKDLPDDQIQKIGLEIANIHHVSSKNRRQVLKEFIEVNKAKDFDIAGGMSYAKRLLSKALGDEKAEQLLEGILQDVKQRPFLAVRKADIPSIINILMDENSQTIAITLAHIQPEKAAAVMSELPLPLQKEVAVKIGNDSSVPIEVIKIIEESLTRKLRSINNSESETAGGVIALVDILDNVDRRTEKNLLEKIENEDTELAERIKENMFVFEDLVKLDKSSIQKVLKEVKMRDIAFALKDAREEIVDTVYKNQSSRAAEALKEEIELLGTVKNSQIEQSQQSIVHIVRKLEKEGSINIIRNSRDEFVR